MKVNSVESKLRMSFPSIEASSITKNTAAMVRKPGNDSCNNDLPLKKDPTLLPGQDLFL